MHLLTWHGTLVCLREAGGGLAHEAIASATPMELEIPAACPDGMQALRTSLGPLEMQPADGGRGVWIARYGQFLCADAHHGTVAFDRAQASLWETFLPVTAQTVAILRHILAHSWIDAADRQVMFRRDVRVAPGFRLMLGDAEIDLTLPLPWQAEDVAAALPESLRAAAGDGWRSLVMAGPRGSALLDVPRWPVRSRRTAETVVVALRRHIEGREPGQTVLEDDVAALLADDDMIGLPGYLERCFPALSMPVPAASGGGAATESAEKAAASFAEGELAHQAGDYMEAVACWSACLAADPDHRLVRKRLGELWIALGRPLAALSLLEEARRRIPADFENAVFLAGRYGEAGWWDRAQAALPETDADLAGWLLQGFRHVRRTFAAQTDLAARLSADEAGLGYADRLLLSQTRLSLGDLDGAEALAEALLRERPGQFPPHRVRVEAWVRRAGALAAIAYLRALDGPFGKNAAHRMLLGRLLLETQDHAEAIRVLTPLLDGPHRSAGFRLLALAAYCAGDTASFAAFSLDWLNANTRETQAARFSIAVSRAAGTLPRLTHGFARGTEQGLQIVQFWHAPEPPSDVAAAMASWPARNPGMEHAVFHKDSARTFIAGHYGANLLDAYDGARHPAMQSDLFRLAYLAVHGGVYVDADEHCMADMGEVFAALAQVQLVAWLSHETFPYAYNGFLVARPGSVIIREALAEAVHLLAGHRAAGTQTDMWAVTGPGLITRAIGRRLAEGSDVLLLADNEYRRFAETLEKLEYKTKPEGNWRLS